MRPQVYIGFTISFLFSFGPEMGTLCVQLLGLVIGGIPLPPEDILQPLGHGIHQVLQVNIHEVKISLVSTCNFILHRSCRILRFFLYLFMFLANQRFIFVIFSSCRPSQRHSQVPSQVATHQESGSQLWAGEMKDLNPGLQDNSLVHYH